MTQPLPSITIVIPNLNGSRFLRECIQSILIQEYPRLQLFFCDGGSSDDSLDIANEYRESFFKIDSIRDNGPAEAINRALMAATGDVFHWINSDDVLEPGALHVIGRAFLQDSEASVVAGKVINFRDSDKSFAGGSDNRNLNYKEFFQYCCGFTSRLNWHQPGCWWKTTHILSVGGVNPNYKAYFDRELFLRLLRTRHNVKYINSIVLRFRFHEDQISHVSSGWKRHELRLILKKEVAYNTHNLGYYRAWLKAYYWAKRLKTYEHLPNSSHAIDLMRFIVEVLKDPLVRLRPQCGTKKALTSLISRQSILN